jgi:signal peptidase I
VVLLYLLVRPHVATIVEVTSPTMAPTLQGSTTPQIDGPNDRLLVSRYLYHLRAPLRGEIVAWKPDDGEPGQLEVGRLMALPGDQIRIDRGGKVHVNDAYVAAAKQADSPEAAPAVTIPEGCLLALGDEPSAGPGGQLWLVDGYVREDQLAGKATAVIWPPDRMRLLD